MTPRGILAFVIGTAACLAPVAAAACPACATREAVGSGPWVLLGAMIAVPYAVGAVVFKVIRSVDRDRGESS